MALIGVLTGTLRWSSQTNDTGKAIQGAQELLDKIRYDIASLPSSAATFDGATNDAPVDGFPPQPYPGQTLSGISYRYEVHSEPVSDGDNLYLLKLVVKWGEQHKVAIDSYVYKP